MLISELRGKHTWQMACVMGGGPSLPSSIEGLPAQVWISANEHGALLRPVDYIVAVDVIHQRHKVPMVEYLARFDVPKISHRFWADYRIPHWGSLEFHGNSGLSAIVTAALLGCNPIVVAGIEFYQNGVYFHDLKAESSGVNKTDRFIRERVVGIHKFLKDYNVRRIGCPLLEFPEYDPEEKFDPVREPWWATRIMTSTGKHYRPRWSYRQAGEYFPMGEKILLCEEEAKAMRAARRLIADDS